MKKSALRTLAAVTVVLLLLCVLAPAAYALETDYEYTVNPDGLGVTITKYVGTESAVTTPEMLGGLPVTAVGEHAFWCAYNLSSCVISEGVTSIGYGAFYGDQALSSVTLPVSLEEIGDEVFTSCDSLTAINIPEGVKSIGIGAFKQCISLASVTVSPANTSFCAVNNVLFNFAKTELIMFPKTKGSSYAIPAGVKKLAPFSFFACDNLERLTFPASLEEIGAYAFASCIYLTSANMSATKLKKIGESAFAICASLGTVKAPDSLVEIGAMAFEDVPWVENYTIRGVVYLGKVALCYDGTMLLKSHKKLAPKAGTVSIMPEAFWWNSDAISFTAPDSLRSIGDRAFTGCVSIDTVTLNDGLVSIGEDAFRECSALTTLTVPASVTDIGERAFGLKYDEENFVYVPDRNFTVYCSFGSAAHKYAVDNNVNFVLTDMPKLGDVNGDGAVTADDAREALRCAAGLVILTDRQLYAADLDKNGTVTTSEARSILRASVGLEAL